MTIAFISDLHLSPQRPATLQLFDDFMRQSGKLLHEIYILGDLFDYWIGDDAAQQLGYGAVEETLKSTVEQDTRIYFMRGNRDFLVGDAFAARTGISLLEDGTVIDLDGEKILLMHGDLLCTDDIEYQKMREQFHAPGWQADFLGLSLDERLAEAQRIRELSNDAKQEKAEDIMDVNPQAVENTLREAGVSTLIHGHTHRPYVHSLDIDGQEARRYVLGDWGPDRSVLYYNQGKFFLKK